MSGRHSHATHDTPVTSPRTLAGMAALLLVAVIAMAWL